MILNILSYPDPRLRTKALPVDVVDASTRAIVQDMFETMYAAEGIGLAATQVNIHQQIIVIDISRTREHPLVFINPSITVIDEKKQVFQEGCLSVPGYYDEVERPEHVTVSALNQHGESFTLEMEGLLATCIQHEMDHLNGKLFVDYLSQLKRHRIKEKLEKVQKQKIREEKVQSSAHRI